MLVHVPEVLEIGREEDIEEPLFYEERATRHCRVEITSLYDGRVDARSGVREGGEVGKEKAMPREMVAQRLQETEEPCGDVFWRRQVWCEREVCVDTAESSGCLEEARYGWWMR
jgi:hypothetical protein